MSVLDSLRRAGFLDISRSEMSTLGAIVPDLRVLRRKRLPLTFLIFARLASAGFDVLN
jgi:hypothetical protein